MKISQLLKNKGLFSNDIKQRFKNNQIKLNGETTIDIELNEIDSNIIDAGDFIFKLLKINSIFGLQLQIFDIETLSNSNINSELKNILSDFIIIRFSKKDIIIVNKIKTKKDNK